MAWNMDKETQRGIESRSDNKQTNFKYEDFFADLDEAHALAWARSLNTNKTIYIELDTCAKSVEFKYVVQSHGISIKYRKQVAFYKNGNKI